MKALARRLAHGPAPPVMRRGCPRRTVGHDLPRSEGRPAPPQLGRRPADPLAAAPQPRSALSGTCRQVAGVAPRTRTGAAERPLLPGGPDPVPVAATGAARLPWRTPGRPTGGQQHRELVRCRRAGARQRARARAAVGLVARASSRGAPPPGARAARERRGPGARPLSTASPLVPLELQPVQVRREGAALCPRPLRASLPH